MHDQEHCDACGERLAQTIGQHHEPERCSLQQQHREREPQRQQHAAATPDHVQVQRQTTNERNGAVGADEESAKTINPAESPEGESRPVETIDDLKVRKYTRPFYQRPAVLVVASIVLLIGAVIGVHYWLYASSHESTDDAFIEGHIIQISPKVSGYVAKVYVTDNQLARFSSSAH